MEEIKLDVQVRNELGQRKVKAVRYEDNVPGVVYGGKEEPVSIKFDRRTYERIRRTHQGESIVFHLDVHDGEKKLKDCSAIVKEEQHNPVTDRILHVDFKRISLKEKIEVTATLRAVGESPGVKAGGSLEHILWEIDIECLPTNIPQHVDVDISALEIGDTICIKDIVTPDGVVILNDLDVIVFSVVPPRKEQEEIEDVDADAQPEVIKEKKEEKEV